MSLRIYPTIPKHDDDNTIVSTSVKFQYPIFPSLIPIHSIYSMILGTCQDILTDTLTV